MKEQIYFIKASDNEDDKLLCGKLQKLLESQNLLSMIDAQDMVAMKTHFGEEGSNGYVRPLYFSMLAKLLKKRGALPFLTETQTLYVGGRSNAVDHTHLAFKHGFTYENTGLPLIMADGLLGDEEIEVKIPGKIYQSVNIASLIVRAQAMVTVTHFTGHLATGFGAALKNLGMGCSSRKGKLQQHSTAKPSIKSKSCTGCGVCIQWCPAGAIVLQDKKAVMDKVKCIGCGECLAVCRFGAVGFTWSETYEQLQRKVVEHAMGVCETKKNKILYLNFLTRITKDCDCLRGFDKMLPDIGILAGTDPVAIDAASLDLVEEAGGKSLAHMAYNVPYRIQIDYAGELGFGNADYQLVTV